MFQPLRDRILLRRHDAVTTTPGGLHIPQTAQAAPRATVVALGTGQYTSAGKRLKLDVAVGDEVVTQKNAGIEVDVDGEKLLVVHEHEIVGVFKAATVRAKPGPKPGKRAAAVQQGNAVSGDIAAGDVVEAAEQVSAASGGIASF